MLRVRQVSGFAAFGIAMAVSLPAFGFGALAIDHVQGPRFGFAINKGSIEAARATALSTCGSNCRVAIVFNNTCAAFAGDQAPGSARYAWASRTTGAAARAAAVRVCAKAGGKQCQVRVWACESRILTGRGASVRDVLKESSVAANSSLFSSDKESAPPQSNDLFRSGGPVTRPQSNDLFTSPPPQQPPLLTALDNDFLPKTDFLTKTEALPAPKAKPVLPKLTLLPGAGKKAVVEPPANTVKIAPSFPIPVVHGSGRRFALVIGNDAYRTVDPLKKAVNDARSVGDALTRFGFEVVRVENGSRREMNRKIVEFSGKVGRGDTAFFFFAGHGVEIHGVNYLLPVDVPAVRDGEEALITGEGIPAETVIDQLQQRGAKVSVMVLDACRDNPFKRRGSRGIGSTRGLAQMTAPEGVFVLYSAGVGQTALDRLSNADSNPNSVFTRTFLRLLGQPNLTLQQLAKRTQFEVRQLAASVSHAQMPAYYDQILGQFALAAR